MSSNLDDLFGQFIGMADSLTQTKGIWREEPLGLVEFFTDQLGERPYPGKQTELLEVTHKIVWWKLTGDGDVTEDELRQVEEMVVMFGKGSGKDFLASGIMAWVCYLLCCMNDPQGYFNFGQGENIDLINVAINAKQANSVYFKKFKARLSACKWFVRTNVEPIMPNEYQQLKDQIKFYQNITAHSAHSEADSFEGYSPLMVIYDEYGGFEEDKAEECYATLRSSSVSRFNEKLLHLFISFPRHMGDGMMKKYREATIEKSPMVWATKGSSWEVNPSIKRSALQRDYDRDPEGSALKYEALAPEYADGLFQFPEQIDKVVEPGKVAQCDNLLVTTKISTRQLQSGEQRHFIGLEMHNLNLNPAYTYYLGGDGGVNTDSYVIALFHAEPILMEVVEEGQTVQKWFNKPVEDLLLQWKPSKKDRLPVDLINVAEILEQICKQVHVKKAIFDKFNSAEAVQRLMAYGVDAEDKNWSNPFQLQIYQNIKGLIYTGQISLLDHTVYDGMNANEELKNLKLINGNKVDHTRDGSKDFADARAGACWICSMDEVTATEHFAMPGIFGAARGSGGKLGRR